MCVSDESYTDTVDRYNIDQNSWDVASVFL
jgi:hypothetical protein